MIEQDAVTALCAWLRTALPPGTTVRDRWPEANVKLQMPTVTVLLVGSSSEFDVDPTPVRRDDGTFERDDSTSPPTYRWRCSFEDWGIQVDCWCAHDQARKRLARQVRDAFRAGARPLGGAVPVDPVSSSVLVPLPEPWGGTADAWIDRIQYYDSSDDTQRSEYRALLAGTIAVAASVKAQSPRMARITLTQQLNGTQFP